jgi:exopolyphosphatase/guanosine-5'-triphosphate,3'-diphosphate pyrophosphatase
MSGEAFSETDYQLMLTYINSIINVATWKGKLLMGSGGGVVACAKVAIAGNASLQTELHNYYLDSAELMRQIELYRRCTAEERRQIPGMEADRADIILASAMIALAIVSAAEAPGLYVCTSGIRQGLIALEVRR